MKNEKINFATRQLIRSSSKCYMATELSEQNKKRMGLSSKHMVTPYVTFLMVAFDYDCSPLLLLSNLSEHTKNINFNNSISLMFYEEVKDKKFFPVFPKRFYENSKIYYEDPMSRPRVTLVGKLKKSNKNNHKRRYILRHPAAKLYANFSDMNIYKLHVQGGHLTGGFAQVSWFKNSELTIKDFKNFEVDEEKIVEHMNNHHQESVNLFSKNLIIGKHKKGDWQITGIDPEGFDIRLRDSLRRYYFENKIKDTSELRKVFVKLHHKAMTQS